MSVRKLFGVFGGVTVVALVIAVHLDMSRRSADSTELFGGGAYDVEMGGEAGAKEAVDVAKPTWSNIQMMRGSVGDDSNPLKDKMDALVEKVHRFQAKEQQWYKEIDTPPVVTLAVKGGVPGPRGKRGARGQEGGQGMLGVGGDTGDRGLTGAKGVEGPQGNQGIIGPTGELLSRSRLSPGQRVVFQRLTPHSKSQWRGPFLFSPRFSPSLPPPLPAPRAHLPSSPKPGDRGDKGPKGIPGAQGPMGGRGPRGGRGQLGKTGIQGYAGTPGLRGSDGYPGPPGPQGVRWRPS